MKRNTFIKTESGSFKAIHHEPLSDASSIAANLGSTAGSSWVIDAEDALIQSLDEQNMSPEKITASRFLTFLGNQRLTVATLEALPVEEQVRLKKEFLGE